jgi:hypothetical protein
MDILSAVTLDAPFILVVLAVICEALAGFNYTANGKVSFMPLGFGFFFASLLVGK